MVRQQQCERFKNTSLRCMLFSKYAGSWGRAIIADGLEYCTINSPTVEGWKEGKERKRKERSLCRQTDGQWTYEAPSHLVFQTALPPYYIYNNPVRYGSVHYIHTYIHTYEVHTLDPLNSRNCQQADMNERSCLNTVVYFGSAPPPPPPAARRHIHPHGSCHIVHRLFISGRQYCK